MVSRLAQWFIGILVSGAKPIHTRVLSSLVAQPLRLVLMPFFHQRNTANHRVIDHCGNEFREWLTLLEKNNNM
tara:strand:- start:438 stop:656 length:219 start_codon:yes stop_codon:yes gene_type:complete